MKFTGRNYLTVRFYKPNLCTLFTYGLTSNRSLYITIIPSITWDRGLRRIRTSVTCDKSKTGYIYSDLGFRQNLTTLIWIYHCLIRPLRSVQFHNSQNLLSMLPSDVHSSQVVGRFWYRYIDIRINSSAE